MIIKNNKSRLDKVLYTENDEGTDVTYYQAQTETDEADYVITESTYGDRYHETGDVNNLQYLADCLQRTFDRGGNVVIPSFAVGRTQ